jgi:hypothetical protein
MTPNFDITELKRYRENRGHWICFSVDLGKMVDFTAWTVAEVKPEARKTTRGRRILVNVLTIRDLRRLPLGTPYDEVRDAIHETFWDERLWLIHPKTGRPIPPQLVIDASGVGDSFFDMMVADLDLKRNAIGYKMVAGMSGIKHHSKSRFTVARNTLFQQLDASFNNKQIIVDPRHALSETLLGELRGLRPEGDEDTGYIKVVHRSGEHDDLSIAVGAANVLTNPPDRPRVRTRIMDSSGTQEIDIRTGTFKKPQRGIRSRPLY